jgi:hypothetical protein
MSILPNLDTLINEAARSWSPLTGKTEELNLAFNGTPQGADLKAIGVMISERIPGALILRRTGGPMADVEIFKDNEGKFCYEYLSSKEGVERYALHKFDTPDECLRSLLLRIVRNNIPGAIIPKKDIPKINFDELIPVGSNLDLKEILARAKEVIGGFELSDPDPEEVVELPIIENLEDMGMVGGKSSSTSRRKIIEKVDIIAPKYKFYSRAALRAGEIYGDLISQVLGVPTSELGGLLFGRYTKRGSTEIWRVNNSNRLPLNSINFRTGDNSVRCNIQDPEIFGSVFLAIFKRTFKRAKGKYVDEFLLSPTYLVQTRRAEKIQLIEEMNLRLSDYFTEAAEDLDPTVFVDPGQENTQIGTNAKAILLKYLMKNGSAALRSQITSSSQLDDLLDLTTKHLDINDLTRKLIDVSRALRFT